MHIENITKHHGLKLVVAINRFVTDTDAELELVRSKVKKFGAYDVCIAQHWEKGGAGAIELAEAVIRACNDKSVPNNFRLSYDDKTPLKEKIEIIAKQIYRAGKVEWNEKAENRLKVSNIII